MNIKQIKLADITFDGGTQTRASMDPVTIEDYAEVMQECVKSPFPPLIVFFDGSIYWLADGFHRLAAAKQVGWVDIECNVLDGAKPAAIVYGMGCNSAHGLRRTNADKRHSVSMALGMWPERSDRAIADMASVSHKLVATVREELGQVPVERKGLDGKVRRLPRGGDAGEAAEGGKNGSAGDQDGVDGATDTGEWHGGETLNDFPQFQQLVDDIASLCKTMEGLSIPDHSRKTAAGMAMALGTRFNELGCALLVPGFPAKA